MQARQAGHGAIANISWAADTPTEASTTAPVGTTLQRLVMIPSHDLELLLELCPRSLVLDGGRIRADGPTSALLSDAALMAAHGQKVPHSLHPRPKRVTAVQGGLCCARDGRRQGTAVQRIAVTIDDTLLAQLDAYMARSEALRDLVLRALTAGPGQPPQAECIGVISYTLDPTLRELSRRVPQSRHNRHDHSIAAFSVPFDHRAAVEVSVMRGRVDQVSAYAEGLFLERGIRHGALSLISIRTEVETHDHGAGKAHSHSHLRVQESFQAP
ncbi:nickel-responsive transcriptional regulator NikR [Pseudogemmobacter sonorensis]|uniref:nickel-responsive transcriptional regulator NikR n=1 Tax=Pseudogemmobacter sonorensis TaxID=2989681 RepID=UPI0036BFB05F